MQALWPSDPERVSGYRVLARLGSGGMGQVYLGRARDGTLVAVKVVRDDVAAELVDRFPREVAAAHRASGRYLAELVGADPHGTPAWLATRYVPGVSLAEAVGEAGPLPVGSVRALMAGLAAALTSIHGANVLHRDLKPGNVLLMADGPRVIDFGISRLLDLTPLTGPGKIWGSPGYLSPEQVTDPDRTGPASDVFALGAVVTFALTGAGPYGDGDGYARIYRLVNEQPNIDGVDPSLRDLVGRCLARDPADRPTPAEIIAALGAGDPVEARFGPGWLPSAVAASIQERQEQLDALIAAGPPVSPAPQGNPALPVSSAFPVHQTSGSPETAPATAAPTRFAPARAYAPAPPPPTRERRSVGPTVLAVVLALVMLAGGAVFVTLNLLDRNDDGADDAAPTPTATASSARADSRPCLSSGRRDLPFYCEVNTRVAGDELKRLPLYATTDAEDGDEPIDELITLSQRQYFVCHRQGSRHTKGDLANHWWALTQGDTDEKWGWLPEIYLLGGDNDDPDGGLPECTDADVAKVTST